MLKKSTALILLIFTVFVIPLCGCEKDTGYSYLIGYDFKNQEIPGTVVAVEGTNCIFQLGTVLRPDGGTAGADALGPGSGTEPNMGAADGASLPQTESGDPAQNEPGTAAPGEGAGAQIQNGESSPEGTQQEGGTASNPGIAPDLGNGTAGSGTPIFPQGDTGNGGAIEGPPAVNAPVFTPDGRYLKFDCRNIPITVYSAAGEISDGSLLHLTEGTIVLLSFDSENKLDAIKIQSDIVMDENALPTEDSNNKSSTSPVSVGTHGKKSA